MNYAIVLIFLATFATTTWANLICPTPCRTQEECLYSYYIGTRKVDFYSNYHLEQVNDCINQVIVAVHGTARDAWSRFDDVFDAVKERGLESQVLVVAPYFKTNEDAPDQDDYYWSSDGWKKGNTSNIGRNDISSFEVTDLMLDTILSGNDFLGINKITITGHSAGGQYTQLYALTSPTPDIFPTIDFSFLVLNPSNYSYLNTYRPSPLISGLFEVPVYQSGSKLKMKVPYNLTAGDCPNSYNDFKYGLDERNYYANLTPKTQLISQYLSRHVYYLLGSLDIYQDSNLDTSCSAKIQGRYRLERGMNFFNFLSNFYDHNHELQVVNGVGHDAGRMYGSDTVQDVMLGAN